MTIRLRSQSGFTLSEFLMVVGVITILCVLAIPQFYALQAARRQAEMEKSVSLLRTAIAHEIKKAALSVLDDQPAGPCITCFDKVLAKPVNHPLWFKLAANQYAFSLNGNSGSSATTFTEKDDIKIVYDPDKSFLFTTSF